MSKELATRPSTVPAELQEKVLLGGDLAKLSPSERLSYYNAICVSVGLNPLTRPFEYLTLNGRMVLYARKDCTDQLRELHGISIQIVAREVVDGCYVVTAKGQNMTERTDESIGAVPLPSAHADKANAMMKAETKAKRRVTLSICGLGILDETELETVSEAKTVEGETRKPTRKPSEILAEHEASVQEPSVGEMIKDMGAQDGGIIQTLHITPASATSTFQDPAEHYRIKLRTCERIPHVITRTYNAIPEELRQDCHGEFKNQLQLINKRK